MIAEKIKDYNVKITVITEVFDLSGKLVHENTRVIEQTGDEIAKGFDGLMAQAIKSKS